MHRGHALYQRYCQSCHGPFGDGRGESAEFLSVKPRDFTRGIYKLRSTPSGTLPTDGDLVRSIREGLWGSGMPRWSGVSDGELLDLVAYVESFSEKFYTEARGLPISIPSEPPSTPQDVGEGRKLYDDSGCAACHGAEGRGDGPSAKELKDDWGQALKVTDLTTGHYKAGPGPSDVYRNLMTGLSGTPMPSFAETLTPQQAWDLVHYLLSLRAKGGWRLGTSPGEQGKL